MPRSLRSAAQRGRGIATTAVFPASSAGAAPSGMVADHFIAGQLNVTCSGDDLHAATAFSQERTGSGGRATLRLRAHRARGHHARPHGHQYRRGRATQASNPDSNPAKQLSTPPDPTKDPLIAVPIMGEVALCLMLVGSGSVIWRRRRL